MIMEVLEVLEMMAMVMEVECRGYLESVTKKKKKKEKNRFCLMY